MSTDLGSRGNLSYCSLRSYCREQDLSLRGKEKDRRTKRRRDEETSASEATNNTVKETSERNKEGQGIDMKLQSSFRANEPIYS